MLKLSDTINKKYNCVAVSVKVLINKDVIKLPSAPVGDILGPIEVYSEYDSERIEYIVIGKLSNDTIKLPNLTYSGMYGLINYLKKG